MKKISLFSIIVVLLMSMLVGCASNGSTQGTEKKASKKNDSQAAKSDTQKILVYGRSGDSVSLDPAITNDTESQKVTQNIFDTLVTFGDQNTAVQPDLATKWDISDDGLKYTLQLHKGVKFQDGTEFNAQAVVYNFQRWINADKNKDERFSEFESSLGGGVIKSVKATGDYTVTFTLKNPQPTFLKNLARASFAMSSPAAIKKYGKDYGNNPVGTGPFIFKDWKRNDKIVLKKNEDYWMKGYPKLDEVIFRTIPDNDARLNALYTGEIDLMDGLNPANVAQIKSKSNLKVFTRPSLNVGYLGFTVTRKPFNNKLVRQALSYAIDKKGIIKAFYAGQAKPAKNLIPESVQGYNDSIQAHSYNIDKAKKLLAQAGYKDGFTMDLWAMPVSRPYMPDAKKVAEVLQSNFKQIGVKVNIRSADWATYLQDVVKGKYDSFLLGWTGTNGDADDFLYTLLDSKNIGSLNSTRYSNEQYDSLVEKARTITNQNERIKLYKQAQDTLNQDMPLVPIAHSTPVLAGKSNIIGFTPNPTGSVILTKTQFK